MTKYLEIAQVAVSILLVALILLQPRGTGLGSTFGGEGGNVYFTKRGAEKIIFILTIILAAAFVGMAFLNLIIR